MASILDTIDRPKVGTYRTTPRLHPAERIARNVAIDPETGCHLWTGHVGNAGYGQITVAQFGYKSRTFSAHKAAYELATGRVPEGMVLDHLCRVRRCVNPAHMEVVSQRQNILRSPVAQGALNAAKTHCPQGHPYSAENTYVYVSAPPKSRTERGCRTCRSEASKKSRSSRSATAVMSAPIYDATVKSQGTDPLAEADVIAAAEAITREVSA